MPNVYTGGTFDLFHEGHIELLQACKRIAGPDGIVTVALNTDEFIERFKGKAPIQTFRERKIMLEACRYVDQVIANIGEEDSKRTIESMYGSSAPDVIAIGSDWAGRDYYAQMGFTKDWLDKKRLVLIYIDRRTGMSTTKIKDKLKNG